MSGLSGSRGFGSAAPPEQKEWKPGKTFSLGNQGFANASNQGNAYASDQGFSNPISQTAQNWGTTWGPGAVKNTGSERENPVSAMVARNKQFALSRQNRTPNNWEAGFNPEQYVQASEIAPMVTQLAAPTPTSYGYSILDAPAFDPKQYQEETNNTLQELMSTLQTDMLAEYQKKQEEQMAQIQETVVNPLLQLLASLQAQPDEQIAPPIKKPARIRPAVEQTRYSAYLNPGN